MAWCHQVTGIVWLVCLEGLGALLLTWINFISCMDKWSHPLQNVGWNYLSIPVPQWCNHWSLEIDKLFDPTLHWACDYLSMLGSKLIRVDKRGHWGPIWPILICVKLRLHGTRQAVRLWRNSHTSKNRNIGIQHERLHSDTLLAAVARLLRAACHCVNAHVVFLCFYSLRCGCCATVALPA